MTMTPATYLYRKAVAYAAGQIEIGTDYQDIEWSLLNLEDFAPLINGLDIEVMYDCVSEIMSEADNEVEDRKIRNIQRWEDYIAHNPELDTHREW
jgi:hypothetical protein